MNPPTMAELESAWKRDALLKSPANDHIRLYQRGMLTLGELAYELAFLDAVTLRVETPLPERNPSGQCFFAWCSRCEAETAQEPLDEDRMTCCCDECGATLYRATGSVTL